MGSMISLGVGRMEIDWGKNNVFNDHSSLFKPEDVTLIPYYYVDDDGRPIIEEKEGLSRNLLSTKNRLDLLGYTLEKVKSLYEDELKECGDHNLEVNLSFELFSKMLTKIDIHKINTPDFAIDYEENGYDLGEFVQRCIIPEKEIYSYLLEFVNGDKQKLNFDLECFFENIDPYIILRLLAENPSCKELNVFWSFADVVEGGWINKGDVVKPLSASNKILIVTEGSSDSFIIQKAINELYPDISDFFTFIDMEKNYPFTGTGNLYNFCCGLMKIGITNKIIVIFDNDTAGNEKYNKLIKFSQMNNLLVTKLPDNKAFENFDTVGPQGTSVENINGTAVAIECFLDFTSLDIRPTIRWTNYIEKANQYQGSLLSKDEYVRKYKNANLLNGEYDVSKIRFLIDYLIKQWCDTYSM